MLVEIIRLKSGRNNDAVAVQRASARLAVDGGFSGFPPPASRLYPYLVLVFRSQPDIFAPVTYGHHIKCPAVTAIQATPPVPSVAINDTRDTPVGHRERCVRE